MSLSELYSRSKLISSSQIRSDILMNLKKRSRSSSQAYLILIFPSSSQWSDVILSSWQVHRETKIPLQRVFAFLSLPFSGGALHHPWSDHELKFTSDYCELEWKFKLRYACELELDLDLFSQIIVVTWSWSELFELYTTLPWFNILLAGG